MRRVGDSYVEATLGRGDPDIAARMNAVIDADGPDAVGVYYGNPSGFSSSNIIFMNGWLDADRHPQPVLRRLDRPERHARGRGGDVRVAC